VRAVESFPPRFSERLLSGRAEVEGLPVSVNPGVVDATMYVKRREDAEDALA
jgi:hypothetical protein